MTFSLELCLCSQVGFSWALLLLLFLFFFPNGIKLFRNICTHRNEKSMLGSHMDMTTQSFHVISSLCKPYKTNGHTKSMQDGNTGILHYCCGDFCSPQGTHPSGKH